MVEILDRYKRLGVELDPSSLPIIKPALRTNTLKISSEKLKALLEGRGVALEPVSGLDDAFYYESSFSLSSTIEYLKGYFYLQGVASMLPARILLDDGKSCGSSILDMCAAPGSKATQLAQLSGDEIPLVACDNEGPRLKALEYNFERMGVSSVATFRKDARFVDDLGLTFDRVLLDAPCSGNICGEKNFLKKRSVLDFRNRSRLQRSLLQAAYEVLVPGGVLVYSTCSLEPEENELVIDWFLSENDDIEIIDTGLDTGDPGLTSVFGNELDSRLSKARRFWPPKTNTEGFFIAKLKKASE
ncbi:MAG: RsmB/NOP family class I SAM-dependent RNA methyltransferase [Nanobdellota archaeon]